MNADDANITLDKIWEFKTTSDDEFKLKLIQQIESQALFIDVALNEPNSGVRKRAVLKMATKFHEELMIISFDDPFWEMRLIALKKLHPMYQNYFIQICITEEFSKIRKLAREKLRFTDLSEDQYTKLALFAYDSITRRAAVRYVRQEDNLLRIANQSHDYRLAESVIDGLESQARLQQIARSAVLAHTRARAIDKIVDEGYLCELLRTETNDFVQENALQKINDIVLLSSLRLTGPQELQTRIIAKIRNLSNSG